MTSAPQPSRRLRRVPRSRAAFTLLEVLLAVLIASGLFLAVLSFYRQTASTREAVNEELDIVGSARRVMQHLTGELRAAAHPDTGTRLSGSAERLRFATTTLPTQGRGGEGLFVVEYTIRRDAEQEPVGLTRFEQPADGNASAGGTGDASQTEGGASGTAAAPSEDDSLTDRLSSLGDDTEGSAADDAETDDEDASETDTEQQTSQPQALLLTDQLRFIRFRYWDGSEWVDSWQEAELPAAVQIMLAAEPVPAELEPEEYPPDVYRRTVSLGYTVPGEPDVEAETEEEADEDSGGSSFESLLDGGGS